MIAHEAEGVDLPAGLVASRTQGFQKPPPVGVVAELAGVLAQLHESDVLPDIDKLREQFIPRTSQMPNVTVILPAVAVYDELLEAA